MYPRPTRAGLGIEAGMAGYLGTSRGLGILAYGGEAAHRDVLPPVRRCGMGCLKSNCKPLAKGEHLPLLAKSAANLAARGFVRHLRRIHPGQATGE